MEIGNLFEIALLLSLLLFSSSAQQPTPPPTNARVIIIGAGISGYATAARLMERGIDDVIILEAESRIGGRIHSIPYRDGFIDLGGQWVHGAGGNSIWELVNSTNAFQFGDTGFDNAMYFFHQSDGVALNQTHVFVVMQTALSILEDYQKMKMHLGNIGDYFHRAFWERLQRPVFRGISSNIIMAVEDFIQQTVCNHVGTHDWKRIQTRQYVEAPETKGSQWMTWRDRGFHTLFDIIQSPRANTFFNVTGRVERNKVVTRIHWHSQEGRVRVECSDNSQYTADHVVVTIPLGVLKLHHTTMFTPALPAWKVSAIDNIEFGTLEKVILEFAQPFWPANDRSWVQFSILWSQADIDSLRGTNREWLTYVKYIARTDQFPNLLQFFIIGARFDNYEFLNNIQIGQDIMWLLQRMLNTALPPPVNIWRSDWIAQPNFRGSYVYFSIDSVRSGATPELMGKSLLVGDTPRLLFAGEATNEFYGYANGALTSGYRVADEISDYSDGNRLALGGNSLWLSVAAVILALVRAH